MIRAENGETWINGNGLEVMSELATIVAALKRNGISKDIIRNAFEVGIKYSNSKEITQEPYYPEETTDNFDKIFGEFFKK